MENHFLKGGIITVHDSQNCGALLQAYALQTVMTRLGIDCEFIDHNRFIKQDQKSENRIKVRKKKARSPKIIWFQAKGLPALRRDQPKRKKACDTFREKYLHVSKRKYTQVSEIMEEPPQYDLYICGSDQIWNPERFDTSEPFFLSFAPEGARKIAYAPSLGIDTIPDGLISDYKRLILGIDYVSVREEKGAELISSITGRNVECVLDPTFLLEKESWESLVKCDVAEKERYIFCYFLNYMSAYQIKKEVCAFAKKNDLKVIVFHPKCAAIDSSWIPAYGMGPIEFLDAIMNAELVITDSFHGTALSIKLEKEFFVYNAESELPFEKRGGRIDNILAKINLLNRKLGTKQVIKNETIDYEDVKRRLDLEIQKSMQFLRMATSFVNHAEKTEGIGLPADEEKCVGCGLCVNVCKHGAITGKLDKDGFWRPTVDRNKCIACGACVKLCPAVNKPVIPDGMKRMAYAAWNKDNAVRKNSSSGGIFSALATEILNNNGVVVGAAMQEDNTVRHIAIQRVEDLPKCRGSKYVQSSIENIYGLIEAALKEGKKVFFTGTGCQVAAIRTMFGRNENIILCDVVCHGVASPGVFADYLHDYELKTGKRVVKYIFRDESKGWNKPCVKIEYDDGTIEKRRWYKDEFIQAFSKNKTLRSSCFECRFSSYPRVSDITIADFWGAKKVGAIYNGDGTSLTIINSDKGEALFERIKNDLVFREVSFEDGIKYNKSAVSSSRKAAERDTLFYYYRKYGYDYIRQKYLLLPGFTKKVIRKVKRHIIGN
ncbi:MAG: polysaccharide pyruvyl transferase family protein [Lachnospiraceae bacterium]|nr:polysaccharide pyruvyl transferase family protein [Lachnospiraceae bacterium]